MAEITEIEKERSRIAADLHDELSPLLSGVKMRINSFHIADKEHKIHVEKTNDQIDNILKRIREISFKLMPNSLLRKGLDTAVKEFINYLNSNSKMRFYCHFENDLKLSEQNSVNMYRIIQEVIHNTLTHSEAMRVDINIKSEKKNVIITISDKGIGFDYRKEFGKSIGFGLRSLQRRTEIMSGQMFLESVRETGTTYIFEIPL